MTSTEFVLEVITGLVTVLVIAYVCLLIAERVGDRMRQRVNKYLSVSEKTFSYNGSDDKEKK